MRLFRVFNEDWYYDETDEVLVAADSVLEAVNIAMDEVSTFKKRNAMTVVEVPFERGILMDSFHAG